MTPEFIAITILSNRANRVILNYPQLSSNIINYHQLSSIINYQLTSIILNYHQSGRATAMESLAIALYK